MDVPVMTQELAARIEAAEIEAVYSRMRGIGSAPGNPLAVEIAQFGGALAFIVRGSPHLELQRVLGLGSHDLNQLPAVLDWFREREAFPHIDLSPYTAGGDLLRALGKAGLMHTDFLTVLYGQPVHEKPVMPVGVTVVEASDERLEEFAAASAEIDGIPEIDRPLWIEVIRSQFSGWRCYLAYVAGKLAGHGAMRLHNGVGVTMYAATRPEFRNYGCQIALLRQRQYDAAQAGCTLMVCSANPTSSSQRNQERVGMRVAYTKAIWTPVHQD